MAGEQRMREGKKFQTARAGSVTEASGKPGIRPMGIQRWSRRPAFRAIFLTLFIGLTGCGKQPINPPRLIVDNDTDMTIQLFLQATILLSRAYGFQPMSYEEIQARTVRAGFKTIPLMIPDTIRATPDLRARMVSDHGPALEDYLANKIGAKPLIKYYIRTGLRASQLICRNYLTRLDESNAYLQFIKDEFGVAAGLASSALVLAGANATLKDSFLLVRGSVDQAFSAYEEFRFLNIDRQAARQMVEAAQAKLAEHYFKRAEEASLNDNSAAGGYTFSDAIDAVSVIEYQCTREGIRFLLNRSISNTPTNMAVDPSTGTIVFKSSGPAVDEAIIDEQKTGMIRTDRPPPTVPPVKSTVLNPIGDVERKSFTQEEGKAFQRAICVTDSGDFGRSGSATRIALQSFFKAQYYPRDGLAPETVATDKDLRRLQNAQGIFPTCRALGLANAFEVGVLSRPVTVGGAIDPMKNVSDIVVALEKANIPVPAALTSPTFGPPVAAALREVIPRLRTAYNLPGPAELDRALYHRIIRAGAPN